MPDVHEKILETDRWPNRAISPQPFDMDFGDQEVVIVQPGWGKSPESHGRLLQDLTDAGYRAIGLDTRYGYTDQTLGPTARWLQRMQFGDTNPFFDVSDSTQNRYFYRRPTGLLQACVDLDLETVSYIGHSEGGRIGLTAALADRPPVKFQKMIIVNGVGTGEAGGLVGMLRANVQTMRGNSQSDLTVPELLNGAKASSTHFISHLRRTLRESRVIKTYDAWSDLDEATGLVDDLVVLNARADSLISFDDAQAKSREYPKIRFIPTEGYHSNIYEKAVRDLIITELVS